VIRPEIAAIFRWTVYSLTALLVGSVLMFGLLIWQGPWIPYILHDGPFIGRSASAVPTGSPTSTYRWNDFTLASYAPSKPGEAPIVLLKNDKGEVKWAIHAEGFENTSVESVHFVDHRTLWHTTVRGGVKWTYGNEGCWWIIDRSGNLVSYYYSW
jgi:hypothetical protein